MVGGVSPLRATVIFRPTAWLAGGPGGAPAPSGPAALLPAPPLLAPMPVSGNMAPALSPESFQDILARLHAFLRSMVDGVRRFFDPPGATYTVQPGDTLWDISQRTLGDGKRWREIYDLNRDQISRPEEIRAGMVLRLPGAPGEPPVPLPPPKPGPPYNGDDVASGLHIPPTGQNPDRATIEKLLERAADKHGIPRPLLKAIALRESNWRQYDSGGNPVAGRNPTTTDWGIMQINDYWHPSAFPQGKTDIVFNILYGARYLKGQYNRYGNWTDAVSAYNAGSVKKTDGRYSNQPYVDFVMSHARNDWGYSG